MLEQFNINLQYLFVHMLVYNKHLLFNMRGMNIKVKERVDNRKRQGNDYFFYLSRTNNCDLIASNSFFF